MGNIALVLISKLQHYLTMDCIENWVVDEPGKSNQNDLKEGKKEIQEGYL